MMQNKPILKALLGAASIIGLSLLAQYLSAHDYINPEQARRGMGIVFGIVLIVMGNALPKKIRPLSDEKCGAPNGQARRRFAGWTFTIAGIIYSLAWLIAPIEIARTIAMTAGIFAVILVMATCFRSKKTGAPSQPPA